MLSLILLHKVDSQRKREATEVGELRGKSHSKGREMKRKICSENRLKTVNLNTLSLKTLIALYLPLHRPCSFIKHAQIVLNYT